MQTFKGKVIKLPLSLQLQKLLQLNTINNFSSWYYDWKWLVLTREELTGKYVIKFLTYLGKARTVKGTMMKTINKREELITQDTTKNYILNITYYIYITEQSTIAINKVLPEMWKVYLDWKMGTYS